MAQAMASDAASFAVLPMVEFIRVLMPIGFVSVSRLKKAALIPCAAFRPIQG